MQRDIHDIIVSSVKITRRSKLDTLDSGCSAVSFWETTQQRGRSVLCNTSNCSCFNALKVKYIQRHCCLLFRRCWTRVRIGRKLLLRKRMLLIRWKWSPAPF